MADQQQQAKQLSLEDVGVGSKRERDEGAATAKVVEDAGAKESEGGGGGKAEAGAAAANGHKEGEGGATLDPKRPLPIPEGDAAPVKGDCEEGRIFFLYRPRVGLEDAKSITDIQRFFMVLSPASRKGAPNRLVVIGKKRLPDPAKKERFYGFIQSVAERVEDVMGGLGVKEYTTATRGDRRTEAARMVGEGIYSIAAKGADVNLVYALEVPAEPGPVHAELKISQRATYKLSVKNPDSRGPSYASRPEKPDYPPEKKQAFEGPPGGYNWVSPKDTTLLDYADVELLFIGIHDNLGHVSDEVKARVTEAAEKDRAAYLEDQKGTDEDTALLKKLREETAADDIGIETKPIKTGEMV